MKCLMGLASILTCALVVFLILYVFMQGVPHLSWNLLSTAPSYLTDNIGILPDILNTLYIVVATILIVVPLGVGAAIYLTEYAASSRIVAAIEFAAETLPESLPLSTGWWVCCFSANFSGWGLRCWQAP